TVETRPEAGILDVGIEVRNEHLINAAVEAKEHIGLGISPATYRESGEVVTRGDRIRQIVAQDPTDTLGAGRVEQHLGRELALVAGVIEARDRAETGVPVGEAVAGEAGTGRRADAVIGAASTRGTRSLVDAIAGD